jgi:Zn-dependent protease with chaperone function
MAGIAYSLVSVTIGAILAFAVTASTPGVSLPAVGAVLMIVGMVGFATFLYLEWQRRRAYGQRYGGGPSGPGGHDPTTSYERDRY